MRILSNVTPGSLYGLMGNITLSTNNENYYIITDYKFSSSVKDYLAHPKSLSALKMVKLNETYLSKTIANLSPSEIKKISLAKALLSSKKYLIFDYFDKDLTSEEQAYYLRLFKRLTTDYGKTILLFTNDLTFLWSTKTIYYVDNEGNITSYNPKDPALLDCITPPPLTEFINLLRSKNIKISDYYNSADLLKALYRIKED